MPSSATWDPQSAAVAPHGNAQCSGQRGLCDKKTQFWFSFIHTVLSFQLLQLYRSKEQSSLLVLQLFHPLLQRGDFLRHGHLHWRKTTDEWLPSTSSHTDAPGPLVPPQGPLVPSECSPGQRMLSNQHLPLCESSETFKILKREVAIKYIP